MFAPLSSLLHLYNKYIFLYYVHDTRLQSSRAITNNPVIMIALVQIRFECPQSVYASWPSSKKRRRTSYKFRSTNIIWQLTDYDCSVVMHTHTRAHKQLLLSYYTKNAYSTTNIINGQYVRSWKRFRSSITCVDCTIWDLTLTVRKSKLRTLGHYRTLSSKYTQCFKIISLPKQTLMENQCSYAYILWSFGHFSNYYV